MCIDKNVASWSVGNKVANERHIFTSASSKFMISILASRSFPVDLTFTNISFSNSDLLTNKLVLSK